LNPSYDRSVASGFDVDNTNVYWSASQPNSPGNAEIEKAPYLMAPSSSTLTQNQNDLQFVVSNGTMLFWGDQGTVSGSLLVGAGLFGIPISGGTVTTYSTESLSAGNRNVAFDSQNLFWTDGPRVLWASINDQTGGTTYPTSLGTSNYGNDTYIYDFVSNGTYVYATYNVSGSAIWEMPVHGGTAAKFATVSTTETCYDYTSLAQDGVNLYALCLSHNEANYGLWAFPLSGATPTQILSEELIQGGIVTDGSYVYFVDLASSTSQDHWLKKVPVGGGSVITLADLGTNVPNNSVRINNTCAFAYENNSTGWVTINKAP
jgi:hypothetical protein